jgi:Rrf2 family protein
LFKLSRTTEYALLALKHLGEAESVSSTKEIAARYDLPEPLLAKVLQRLKAADILCSVQGKSGGYKLSKSLEAVSFAEILMHCGERTALVDCVETSHGCDCRALEHCDIRGPMMTLNARLAAQFDGLDLETFFAADQLAL